MNRDQLKQRIVGAIVLVALGVIFIPMILNRDTGHSGISGSNIPARPAPLTQLSKQPMPTPPAVPPQPTQTRTLVDKDTPALPKAAQTQTEPAQSKPAKTADSSSISASVASKPAMTHGWVVQLASFTKRKTALQLRDRVRKGGYTCYVEALTDKRGTLYRVRVGPVIKHQQAESLQKKITRQFRLKGTLIMSHP